MPSNGKNILVIVESPAKCKKIEEYLGEGYTCISTYGHLRTISHLKDIDIKNNFHPTYSLIDEPLKKKQIVLLRKEIKKAKEVIIASDLDREGEMIAYSIIELFDLPLNTKRITFNEVTETALKNAISKPTVIDIHLVNAQKSRQILDLLVGFKISPILWKLISCAKGKSKSLSAGRCQTPALNLVYDNYKEIETSLEKKVYNTTGFFTKFNLPFELNKQMEDDTSIQDFLHESKQFTHIYTCSNPIKKNKTPPEPFTTSRLQQVASNEFHYSPKETMSICQSLYEKGYITYMRTDSKEYSHEFLDKISDYILKTYTTEYLHPNLRSVECEPSKQVKPSNAEKITQDAHEAIRPTNISLQVLPKTMNTKENKMYKLIWTNTLESCMSDSIYHSITASISAPFNTKYSYTTEINLFPGWKIVHHKFSPDNKEYHYLQTKTKEVCIDYNKIYSKVTIKGSKLHYTEARLVQLLEEKNIGRPSTFSFLIDKIQERGYVKKQDIQGKEVLCKDFELTGNTIEEIENKREFGNEKSKLVIQPLGIIVIEFLMKHFERLFNYEYTSIMERSLDQVSKGELVWSDICLQCHNEIDHLVNNIENKKKIEVSFDEKHTFLIGKYGPVIKCVGEDGNIAFEPVRKDIHIDMDQLQEGKYQLEDIMETPNPNTNINSSNPKNSLHILGKYQNEDLILKKGKFGLYVSWGNNFKSLKELGNRPMENITLEEVTKILETGSNIIREISKDLSIRKGPKGDYIFYKNSKMKKPVFYNIKPFETNTKEDYKCCDISILKKWIEETYLSK